jgi:hypothetical protein
LRASEKGKTTGETNRECNWKNKSRNEIGRLEIAERPGLESEAKLVVL